MQKQSLILDSFDSINFGPPGADVLTLGPGFYEMDSPNTDRFTQGYFNQPLTTYAVGGYDKIDLAAELEALAPSNLVPRLFTYKYWTDTEQFLRDAAPNDDLRAIGGDFAHAEYTSTKVTQKTLNRGLLVVLDRDEIMEFPGWQQSFVNLLMRRVMRNEISRIYSILTGMATNTNRTWSSTDIDPISDMRDSLRASADAAGFRPNVVVYGETADDIEFRALRSDSNAGRFAAASASDAERAATLRVDKTWVSKSRYQSSPTAKSQFLGSKVLSFYQIPGTSSIEDPSHIKRFNTPTMGGGVWRVFEHNVEGMKRITIGVEYYSLIVATYATGVRQETIS